MNSLRNPSESIEESKWIFWGIQVNLLRNEGIHWGIQVNSFRNLSALLISIEFILFKWICWFKKILKWLKNLVLARRPITLVLVHYLLKLDLPRHFRSCRSFDGTTKMTWTTVIKIYQHWPKSFCVRSNVVWLFWLKLDLEECQIR